MKVICINDEYLNNFITIGKIYDIVDDDYFDSIMNTCYHIINDKNIKCWHGKEHFKTISEMRKDKINKLIEE